MKTCSVCEKEFPETRQYFYRAYNYPGEVYRDKCKACHKEQASAQDASPQRRARRAKHRKENSHSYRYSTWLANIAKRGIFTDIDTQAQHDSIVLQPCHYCGTMENPRGLDRKVYDGSYTKSNVVPACKSCNSKKKRRSYEFCLLLISSGLWWSESRNAL